MRRSAIFYWHCKYWSRHQFARVGGINWCCNPQASGMSAGNIIGSNIFDGFIPIGFGATISATNMEGNLSKFDLPALLAATVMVLIFLYTKRGISKPEGIILIIFFLLYLAAILFFFEGKYPF